ncbi:MAG: hypothetical protein J7527_15355, partial [Chitinophagaceae bacterium]|nr:hypothetical protein [Chitinophagaceae bacterium]
TKLDDRSVMLTAGQKKWKFTLISGNARLTVCDQPENYWAPYPAFKACALVLEVPAGTVDQANKIVYSLAVIQ